MTLDQSRRSAALETSRAALRRAMRATRRGTLAGGRAAKRGVAALSTRLADSYEPARPELNRMIATPSGPRRALALGAALTIVGVILVGFATQMIFLSSFKHERDQESLYGDFRYQLADATAPVAQIDDDGNLTPLGTPVAILSVPKLGISEVVLEGSTSTVTISGPGHRRDTALPGQRGVSVIMGRSGAYGAPFAGIELLAAGDKIEVLTGQGAFTYEVVGVRREGDPQPADLGEFGGRLTLVTADGPRFLPTGVLRVDAELRTEAAPTPAPVLRIGSLGPEEAAMGGDPSAWLPVLLLAQFGLVVVVLTIVAMRRWGRWHSWIVALPVALWIGSALSEQVSILLPNVL